LLTIQLAKKSSSTTKSLVYPGIWHRSCSQARGRPELMNVFKLILLTMILSDL